MNKKDIIEELFIKGKFKQLLSPFQVTQDNKDDFEMDLMIILLEMDEEKIVTLYNKKQLDYYILRIIKNNICSTTSQFWYKYGRYDYFKDELIDTEDKDVD